MIRYAVVVAGWISQTAFIPAIALLKNSVITVIVSGSPERARELVSDLGNHRLDLEHWGGPLQDIGSLTVMSKVSLPNPVERKV